MYGYKFDSSYCKSGIFTRVIFRISATFLPVFEFTFFSHSTQTYTQNKHFRVFLSSEVRKKAQKIYVA